MIPLSPKTLGRRLVAVIIFAAGIILFWVWKQADADARSWFESRLSAEAAALQIEDIRDLQGTSADEWTPGWQRLEDQLTEIRERLGARNIYLLRKVRQPGGSAVIFLLDIQSGQNEAHPPARPGEAYAEASARMFQAFEDGLPVVEGLLADRWGIWISALVPIRENSSEDVVAILGADYGLNDWAWIVAERAIFPSLAVVVLVGLFLALLFYWKPAGAPGDDFIFYLLLPVTLMLLVLGSLAAFLLWKQNDLVQRQAMASIFERAHLNIPQVVHLHTQESQILLRALAAHPRLADAIANEDPETLALLWHAFIPENGQPSFSLRGLFFDREDRLLYDSEPSSFLNGQVRPVRARGLFLDASGELFVSQGMDVFRENEKVGWIECREKFADIFSRLNAPFPTLNFALVANREEFDKAAWQRRMARQGYEMPWDALRDHAIIDSSWKWLPESAFPSIASILRDESGTLVSSPEMEINGQKMALARRDVYDSQGNLLAHLLLATDISGSHHQFHRELRIGTAAALAFLIVGSAFLAVLLLKANRELRERRKDHEEKQRVLSLLNQFAQSAIAALRMIFDERGQPMDFEIISVNPAFEKHTGWKAKEVLKRPITEMVSDIHETGLIERYGAVAKTGKPDAFSVFIESMGRDFVVNAFPMGGDMVGIIFVDVTEQQKAQRELARLNHELEKALKAAQTASAEKSAFLKRINHEFITPMNGILGFSEMLEASLLDPEQRENLQYLKESALRLMALVNQLLLLEGLDEEAIHIQPLTLNLRQLFREQARSLGRKCRQKGLEFRCRMHRDVPKEWCGDPLLIRRALSNLFQNAIKFTPRGRVTLLLKPGTGDGIRWEVRDTGMGVVPEKVHHLFEPFWQADESLSRQFEGAGLGLAVAKLLVHRMGGEIGYEPIEGGGSCFWITLPPGTANP